jgi:hypothetical protein
MELDHVVLPSEDPLAIDEPPRTKPKVTLATLDLRWLVAAIFVFALLANLVVPICIEGWERSLSTWNRTTYGFRWSEWIGGMAYGLKLGELLMMGVFLGLGHYHWAKRLLIVCFGTFALASAHIVGNRWAGWAPPMSIAVMCYLVSFAVTLVAGVFLGLIAKWNLWILDRQSLATSTNQVSHQFDTRLLFGIMIAVAIWIPLLKSTLSLTDAGMPVGNEIFQMALWSAWLSFTLCSLMVVQSIACLVPNATKTIVAFGILIVVGPVLFQWVALNIVPFKISWGVILFAYWISFGVVGSTSFVFVLLRWMGYQLRKGNGVCPM